VYSWSESADISAGKDAGAPRFINSYTDFERTFLVDTRFAARWDASGLRKNRRPDDGKPGI
jgi:hypothetical protein